MEKFRRSAWPALRGSIVVALITAGAYRIHLNTAAAGFAYLIATVLNCLDSGMIAAGFVSLVAVGCLDYFFIQPIFTFTVADPVDVAALGALLTTSLVVTRLASNAREKARAAERERRNFEGLYELAQRLLALDPLRAERSRLLESIQLVFHLQAACMFDAATAEVHTAGDPRSSLPERTRDAYIQARDSDDANISVRCLRVAGKSVGAIGFEGLDRPAVMAGPVAALAAASLERARAVRAASEAAAETRTEALRGAILDALAHEFKTPLAAILTAAGGLPEAGPLTCEQAELAEIVETEAERLSRLSSRLLRLARLDRDDVRPRLASFDIEAAVTDLVDRYSRQSSDHGFSIVKAGTPGDVRADAELLPLALSQLFDNACRYSPPESNVEVSLEFAGGRAAVTVWNSGGSIPATEAGHIFERFYRGAQGQKIASGSGLGLYIARKIAVAHGGSLDLDFARARDGVAFRFTIPISQEVSDFAERTSSHSSGG